ncbi:MAG: DUF4976 domain-containing protein, partial [Verrucomicrobiae bacterium]|nr:DUF4976 domain-containing protein [Verrucomicrobiae bacterium]
AKGESCPSPVEFVDIYPTVADLAGLTPPENLEGTSLRALLKNPNAPWDRPAFSQVDFREVAGRAVRNRRWRYVEWGENGSQGIELYDQQNDPTEMNNLAAEAGHEAIVQEMKALLDHQRRSE